MNFCNYCSCIRRKCNINACSCSKVCRLPRVHIGPFRATGPAELLSVNRIYVANFNENTVSVIDGATNAVIDTIPVGINPAGVAVNPLTNRIYVGNLNSDNVSVIDGSTNTVIATIPAGDGASAVAVNTATNAIYVANSNDILSGN
jgi:YVTN family beta-propeller protein